MHKTKRRLLDVGLELMLERGYTDTGLRDILDRAGVPRGSFYHHFRDKEDFAFGVVDVFVERMRERLETALSEHHRPPLQRARRFFELLLQDYERAGAREGCLLGTLGQELAAVNERFRQKIEACMTQVAERLSECLDEARVRGDLGVGVDPDELANLLINGWEGALLRMKLQRSTRPLHSFLRYHLGARPIRI